MEIIIATLHQKKEMASRIPVLSITFLTVKYLLRFVVGYVQLITQQYETTTPLQIKVATMKNMDNSEGKPSCATTKLTLVTVSEDKWHTKTILASP